MSENLYLVVAEDKTEITVVDDSTIQVISTAAEQGPQGIQGLQGPPGTISESYTPGTPGDWNGTAPTTISEAIDRLAALVKVLNSGTGA